VDNHTAAPMRGQVDGCRVSTVGLDGDLLGAACTGRVVARLDDHTDAVPALTMEIEHWRGCSTHRWHRALGPRRRAVARTRLLNSHVPACGKGTAGRVDPNLQPRPVSRPASRKEKRRRPHADRDRPPHRTQNYRTDRLEASGRGHSGVGKTRRGCLSGMPAGLVVAVSGVTRQGFGRFVCVLGVNCPPVRGGAGLASAFGLIRSLSALGA
jgi:hypothetical protein